MCVCVCVCVLSLSSSDTDSTDFIGSITIHPYRSSLLAGRLDCIQCLHRTDTFKFLLNALKLVEKFKYTPTSTPTHKYIYIYIPQPVLF